LQELQEFQNSALRTSTGAFFSSDVEELHVHANTMPLDLRREFLLVRFLARVARMPDNHVAREALDAFRAGGNHRSVLARADQLARELRLPDVQAGQEPIALPLDAQLAPCASSPPAKPANLVEPARKPWPEDWIRLWWALYTDGSCMPTNPGPGGAGVWSAGNAHLGIGPHKGSHPVGRRTTINTCELLALRHALEHVLANWPAAGQPAPSRVVLLSDSQWAIHMIYQRWRARRGSHATLLAEIWRLIAQVQAPLEVRWVKAHVGVPGNEAADDQAKAAARRAADSFRGASESAPYEQAVAECRGALEQKWGERWLAHCFDQFHFSLRSFKPTPIGKMDRLLAALDRDECRTVSQLFLRRLPVNQVLRRFGLADSADCPHCGQRETERHFMLECRAHARARRVLFAELRGNDREFPRGAQAVRYQRLVFPREQSRAFPRVAQVRHVQALVRFVRRTRRFVD